MFSPTTPPATRFGSKYHVYLPTPQAAQRVDQHVETVAKTLSKAGQITHRVQYDQIDNELFFTLGDDQDAFQLIGNAVDKAYEGQPDHERLMKAFVRAYWRDAVTLDLRG